MQVNIERGLVIWKLTLLVYFVLTISSVKWVTYIYLKTNCISQVKRSYVYFMKVT